MIEVRFIGAEGGYQSIETQAIRIQRELALSAPERVRTHLTLLPQNFFQPRGLLRRLPWKAMPWKAMESLCAGMDFVVVVKSSLFWDFTKVASRFREMCHAAKCRLISNPCDGPGADGGDTRDPFSEEIADAVIAISRQQYDDLVSVRHDGRVRLLEHASRLEKDVRIEVRPTVERVVWENPVHHNPRYDPRKAGGSRESLQALEDMLQETAAAHGVELIFIDAWRQTQSYPEWERILLSADIAVECKALHRAYVHYQMQKPAVKVLNYLSLGLPVICDSVPAYLDLGEDDHEMLFADDLETWKSQFTRLLTEPDLRQRLSDAGWRAAQPFQIGQVCARYLEFFEEVLGRRPAPETVGSA